MKKSKSLFVVFFVISQIACQDKSVTDSVCIKIILPKQQREKLKGSYLYLYDVGSHTALDSVIVNGENILFNLKIDSSFEPHEVVLKHNDKYNHFTYKRPVGFKNPYVAKTIMNSFYIDKGITIIGTYYNDTSFVSIYKGSRQNEPYFKNIALLYPVDSMENTSVVERDAKIIDQYPYSLLLLKQLFYYKEHFSSRELKQILLHFNNEVRQTNLYKSFNQYFAVSAGFDKSYPAGLQFQDSSGAFTEIGNDKAQYNLLVFWASWCGPCRKEIPSLKKMYALYKKKGLVIYSISIDGDKESWKAAVRQEEMPWKQFIAIDSTRKLLDLHYNIKFIPKAYLFDKQKNLIRRFEGTDSELEKKFESIFISSN